MTPTKYAIAVEDSGQLFLLLDITKSNHGDVYVNFNEHHPNHQPHSSYHASGQRHHKSHGYMVLPKKHLQPPNQHFKGSENVITTSVRRGEGKAWNVICQKESYSKVMVIRDEILTPQFGFQLSVDLYESGFLPGGFSMSSLKIIQQEIFNTEIPQVVATLYEVLSI